MLTALPVSYEYITYLCHQFKVTKVEKQGDFNPPLGITELVVKAGKSAMNLLDKKE